ncbi:MAG: DNA methylase [Clostridia bacterium]|nr:DNA methylase [Clostridia bacterium]
MEQTKQYIAIDLKSFYASVECRERGLDPLTANLVVADPSRTEKTICLAVSPSLKRYGIPGRARLFEVIQHVKEVNRERLRHAPNHRFTGKSTDGKALDADPSLELDYIVAPPQMAHYMQRSTEIVDIYLRYVSFEDMHVYSIDEVFIDVTGYLPSYRLTAYELAKKMIRDVLQQTGITATVGIGTNLYLCKIAMDVMAKKMPADADGVRIAELNELTYRKALWDHRPLTDFWRIGRGIARKLEAHNLYTMGDIARCSVLHEDLLYDLFGVNAEYLIDHAWGWEPTEIRHIKAYRPESNSLSVGQVLQGPTAFSTARIIVQEMTDALSLSLVEKQLVTDQIVLTVGYDVDNLKENYKGEIDTDYYGRSVPKPAHGSENIGRRTSSTKQMIDAAMRLYDRIVDPSLSVRRMYVIANHVQPERVAVEAPAAEQLDLFSYGETVLLREAEEAQLKKERKLQEAMIAIKGKYGKNAILAGTSYQEGATGRERNRQIGGHKA